jgi:hypothetical protein
MFNAEFVSALIYLLYFQGGIRVRADLLKVEEFRQPLPLN